MDNDSLYLFNPPERQDKASEETVNKLIASLTSPQTEDDVAYKVNQAAIEGINPNLSFDEFKLYNEWHKKQEIDWWDVASSGVGHFFSEVGGGLASLQPFGEKNSLKDASLNLTTRLVPTTLEAFGRGSRDMVGLYNFARQSGNSPLYRLFNPNDDIFQRYVDFNKLADWNATSTRIMAGKENVVMPNALAEATSELVGEDVTTMTPQKLYQVNNRLAQAGSYFLDPVTLATLGSSALAKAGGKAVVTASADAIAKAAIKEGVTSTASAAINTATKLEVASLRGSKLTEIIGKSFRVAGEVVDKPISAGLDWIKRQASELLDANIHDTPSGNVKVTGATKGQSGFGGAVMAGLGYGSWAIPYAAGIIPIWAVANAAKIGGAFVEAVGKEMAHGSGVLQRLGLVQSSTGKLARTFNRWSPMGSYVAELAGATLKSGAYGAAIGYVTDGEQGAASGLGVGAAIGTSHYHVGLAHNMFRGKSREAMTIELIKNIDDYRKNGFTQKADAVLKYLNNIREQHGDDAFYRNLGIYLAVERDADVALSIWDREDFLRMKNDPNTPADVRKAIEEVVSESDPTQAGQGWNGLFWGRRGKKPYFLYKDGKSAKTHIVINAWAVDADQKVQATGLKGEFYHALSDAYKEASGKERFKEEVFEGISRTLGFASTPEGRTKMAEVLRNAAQRLGVFNNGVHNQPSAKARTTNLLRIQRQKSPAGWSVDHVMGNVTVTEGGVKRPLYYWQSRNGWSITETSDGRYNLVGKVDGKTVRYEAQSLHDAILKHGEVAPMDLQTSADNIPSIKRKKPKIKPVEGQVDTSAGPRVGETPQGRAMIEAVELDKRIDSLLKLIAEKQGGDISTVSKERIKTLREVVKRLFADGWVHDERLIKSDTNIDSTMADLGWYHPDMPNATIEGLYGTSMPTESSSAPTPKATATQQGTPPPNVAGERTDTNPPRQAPRQNTGTTQSTHSPQTVENIYSAIDHFEKTGELRGQDLAILIEEMGESIWDAHENDVPFDYIYLAGDLGFARNIIDELKHRFARIIDRNGRQAGFVADFNKPFVDWFKDKDGKAIVDPYMRKLFKQFLEVHKNRKANLDGYTVDVASMSPAMQRQFVEENDLQDLYDVDQRTGNYVKKPEEVINAEQTRRYQAAAFDLIELEKSGVDTGMHIYAVEKDTPSVGTLDEENNTGALKQEAWRSYRTNASDIADAQRRGTMPTKEELQQMVKNKNFGRRGRPRTGDIDSLVATAKKGTIVFSGVPTVEAFKILQKHLPKREIEAIAQIAPLILDGGLGSPNVARVKYAGFEHVDDVSGVKMKRSKDKWVATEKSMVFYGMELRATLRNINTGKFDYKTPHAHFLLHGVDIDVLQRRIQWMWKNEKETAKRWSTYNDFEKDVYRLIENYSMKSAIGGNRFFGGGAEGKAKKRLACAAIGAFPSKSMLGLIDGDEAEFDIPEIDWHHYQLRSYGKGKNGKDIPWTAMRADGIKQVLGTADSMRVPYAERAYYRAQEMYQPAAKKAPRNGDDLPANMVYVSQELQSGRAKQIFSTLRPTGDWAMREKGYSPNDVIRAIANNQYKQSPEKQQAILDFVKGGIGHDEATNSALVFWHWSNADKPFEFIEQGQVGLHFGTREASLYRALKVSTGTRTNPLKVADNVIPLVVRMKKPITLLDRGAWSPDDIVETILYSYASPSERKKFGLQKDGKFSGQPRVESAWDKHIFEGIKDAIGPLTQKDLDFLNNYKSDLIANKVNTTSAFLAQAEMLASGGVSAKFDAMSKRQFTASTPLHKWLESKGVDGIRYRNSVEGTSWSYIAFSGKQVKNLIQNNGEYSPQNISMFKQKASRYGAKNAEQAKALESNYNQAVAEGDIFNASSIKDNFLGGMPRNTAVIRQMADEAQAQGISLAEYNKQFNTGSPAVFPAVHATDSQMVAIEGAFDSKARRLSQGESSWWASHVEVGQYFRKNRDYLTRALVKTNNPLVVDAKQMRYDDKNLGVNNLIVKAKADGHDSLILTNIADDISLSTGEPILHNQIVVFKEFANDNIAVIDNDVTNERPVPRGIGIDVGEAPLRQDAANVKRTFYSAVEKVVQEKITDKTSLNELMGLLDPTKGTGIVKSELEFLDIAGWVEDQKKQNPAGNKAKVNKQALLDYIKAHKFELQEDITNTAWYTLQGLDPNSPLVQSQIEGGYEGFTPANKGYDDFHPTTNYRVLILRAPQGTDYSGGEGGHFKDHENIIAFARVGDIYLDRVTELPSPEPVSGKSIGIASRMLLPEERVRPDADIGQFERTVSRFLNRIKVNDIDAFKSLSPDAVLTQMVNNDVGRNYGSNGYIPSSKMLEDLGFALHRLSKALPRGKAVDLIKKVDDIVRRNTDKQRGTFDFADDNRDIEINRALTDESYSYHIFNEIEKIAEAIPDSYVDKDGGRNTGQNYNGMMGSGRITTIERARTGIKEAIALFQSYIFDEVVANAPRKDKKKMLMIFESQSDTAQKMQNRNDAILSRVRTPQEQARLEEVLKRINEIDKEMHVRVQNHLDSIGLSAISPEGIRAAEKFMNNAWSTMTDIYEERNNLVDERAVLGRKKEATVIKDTDIKKTQEYKDAVQEVEKQYNTYKESRKFFDDALKDKDLTLENLFSIGEDRLMLTLLPDFQTAEVYEAKRRKIRQVTKILSKELVPHMFEKLWADNPPDGTHTGKFSEHGFERDAMNRLYDESVSKYLEAVEKANKKSGVSDSDYEKIWIEATELYLKNKNSARYEEMKTAVLAELNYKFNFEHSKQGNINFKYSSPKEQVDIIVQQKLNPTSNLVVLESMPFLRTEDFTKLMFKKILKEAVDNGYEGIILIPAELPQKITGGESQYFYGTIYPKVINNYAKKFGGKLRQNKSQLAISGDTKFVEILNRTLDMFRKYDGNVNFEGAVKSFEALAAQHLRFRDNVDLQKENYIELIDRTQQRAGISYADAKSVVDYFLNRVQGTLPLEQSAIGLSDDGKQLVTSGGKIAQSASARGLILDITPQMDAIKEGQPMWQPAARRKKKATAGETTPETVGDIRGESPSTPVPVTAPAKKDRTIGEREAGSDIPEVGNRGIVTDSYGTDLDQRLAKDGVADYRGYKIIYDKTNGGYKMMDPAGKSVNMPVAYIDKITGEKVITNTKHVVFPYEAAEFIDSLLGGMPEKPKQQPVVAQARADSPAMVSKPAQPATPTTAPVAGGRSELEIVQSQLDKTKKARYYLYNIEYDPSTKTYMAKDNSGQPVQMLFPSTFQSGERFLQSSRNASLELVLQGLDKKFDKQKWARLAPRDAESKPTPQAQATPVEPTVAPVAEPVATPAPAPRPAPTRRVEASSVPAGVRTQKPKRQPKPAPNVNIPKPPIEQPQPEAVVPVVATAEATPVTPVIPVKPEPKPVQPTADAWEVHNAQNADKPTTVMSDNEVIEKQAKALGKGFISMMKDPELAQLIIDSLNRDDNLTLKGTKDLASTADGRFSVERKGKKYVITQNNYKSPITGIQYDKRLLAYVNDIHQAQILIRRIELERSWSFAENRIPVENPLVVLARKNPAYSDAARMKEIKDNAMIQMLMSMRDQGITPIHIDPVTLEPLLVMLPSPQVIREVTAQPVRIAGLLPQSTATERSLPLAVIDQATIFKAIDDVVIKGLEQQTREQASRYRNELGYEILKFKGKFRLFNPMKGSISVRDNAESCMDDILRDIHKNGIRR